MGSEMGDITAYCSETRQGESTAVQGRRRCGGDGKLHVHTFIIWLLRRSHAACSGAGPSATSKARATSSASRIRLRSPAVFAWRSSTASASAATESCRRGDNAQYGSVQL